ncbi:class I SAM-dependent methyltransferase [Gloeomargarita sp.]
MTVRSPISGSSHVRCLRRYSSTELGKRWQNHLGVDIAVELQGHAIVELYECLDTGLQFFYPLDVAGSEHLYRQLQKHEFYYMADKWEYDQALRLLQSKTTQNPGSLNILEVGCGRGYFVQKLQRLGVKVVGLELNQSAVDTAQTHNLPVYAESLATWAQQHPQEFTHICSFQVLEHLAAPKQFIHNCLACLVPNGQLIFAVPNRESFTRHLEYDLLDMPPHHLTRWCARTFAALEHYFPLQLERIFYEPLAPYHVDWYVQVQMERLWRLPDPHRSLGHKILYKLVKPLYRNIPQIYRLILNAGLRNYIRGHTMLVVLRKR